MPNPNGHVATLTPYPKGVSGNARGVTRGYKRVLHAASNASPEAMDKAIQCMRDENAPWPQRLKAVEIILDRAWGAPDQRLDLAGADGSPIVIVTGVRRELEDHPAAEPEHAPNSGLEPPTITINTGVTRHPDNDEPGS